MGKLVRVSGRWELPRGSEEGREKGFYSGGTGVGAGL